MPQATFRIHRILGPSGLLDERTRLHKERSALLHKAFEKHEVEVVDWGETDGDYPREVVEIVVGGLTSVLSTILIDLFKEWQKKRKVKDVEIVQPNGGTISIARMSDAEREVLGEYMWRNLQRD